MEDVTVLTIKGSIDTYTVRGLYQQLDVAVATRSAKLVLNLADVDFMDSSGLAALVQGMKKCRDRGGDLYLCNLQQPVRMILELTRLDKALEIFPSEQDAVASFS
jgi:anti-sigma B factor antagonist